MAITVGENGYLTVAEYKAWADEWNKDYAGKSDELIESAITVSGVGFIDTTYKFKGDKLQSDQKMNLPTDTVSIADILNGAAQAAFQQLNGELFVDFAANAKGQVVMESTELDVLKKSVQYAPNTQPTYTYNTTLITRLIAPYTVYSGGACWGRG